MKRRWLGAGVGVPTAMVVAAVLLLRSDRPPSPRPRVELAGRTFHVEIADTDPARQRGLSGRHHLPPDYGMLFVFPDDRPLSFWMKDCRVPIDIAFLDSRGRVLNTHEMTVEPDPNPPDPETTLRQYRSNGPARYALEVAGGTFRRLRVRPGMTARLLDMPHTAAGDR